MGPLHGTKVVEMAGLAPAPFGGMLLADYGADVIQVKRGSGDAAIEPPEGPLDRGKHAITLDLKAPDGLALLHDLVRGADVFLEGFRPGAAERLGIGPEDLHAINPGLVYGRMTGWGQQGPLAERAGHDINYIALAGALDPIGPADDKPQPPLNLLGDFAGGGMLLALGIAAALFERERSGEGQVVDAAMVDGSSLLMSFIHGLHANGLWQGGRGENLFDGGAPFYDTYECADGHYVAVGAVEPAFYAELLRGLGLDGDATDLPTQFDVAGWPTIRATLEEAFRERTRDEWEKVFAGTDACVTPVLSPWEAPQHPHHQVREAFVDVDGVVQPAPAPRFSRTPTDRPATGAASCEVFRLLADWGVPEERVTRLRNAGVLA